MTRIDLVAHRGEPELGPENTLAGFTGALISGARYLETDVQLTRDGIAVLCHDGSLTRVTGHELEVAASDYAAIRDLPAGEPGRFGTQHTDQRIARLDEFVELLQAWPNAHAFVEIKPAGYNAHGMKKIVDSVLQILEPVLSRSILISFDADTLVYVRTRRELPIGWVIPRWNSENRARATTMAPEYLFCNRKRLPPPAEPLWPGNWRWVVYTVNTAEDIPQLIGRGICLLETNGISRLLADPRLRDMHCD